MSNNTIYSSAIVNELPEKEQLRFYRDNFEFLHCALDGCGHEVGGSWVIYRNELYCSDCYKWKSNDDRTKAMKRIRELEASIQEIEKKYGLERAILDED